MRKRRHRDRRQYRNEALAAEAQSRRADSFFKPSFLRVSAALRPILSLRRPAPVLRVSASAANPSPLGVPSVSHLGHGAHFVQHQPGPFTDVTAMQLHPGSGGVGPVGLHTPPSEAPASGSPFPWGATPPGAQHE